ncbi:hypothetical protein V6N13_131329 [Hibiscus sabdariffa]|uniref:Nuclear factor related to kappa-B-binding protein second winged helix domain-containing protein n=1 Tax=Hibiscus sabdariffa TaxID=183260 RepID=A0ABR2D7L1_9ROSI
MKEKHGKEAPLRTSSFQSVKYPEIDGSMGEFSYKENVAQYSNVSSEANCATMGTSGAADGGKHIERDIEAALILIELSNDHLCSLKSKLQFPSRNGACLRQQNRSRTEGGCESMNNNVVGKFGTNGLEVSNSFQEPEGSIVVEKLQFGSRCPTAHPGFSFSIIHFLSAIRTALITPLNPGDPCILEAREPLQELIRGALAIFSSTTAPLGANGWKALTAYSKCNKSWSWIGPLAIKPHNDMNEGTSSEAWGLPSRTVLKLANCFADWLKISQEGLQKIGSLPAPPLTLMHQTVDVTERLREVQPRKTVATISRCPEEIRDYFRKEEAVRYFVPERAFSYTALDGRKSTVAPLRRCSGKPSLKCREHFMLKADRPPNVTVLSLVRDAAARLPDRMGTRADVCVLIRDSQYMVEEISDEPLNQVVSGALDRLHYEHDPCVQFNSEKKLWFYLHGDREEDDFEYDATFSTRKRRRQR